MDNWKIFEKEACKYLNQHYSSKTIKFKQVGESNSRESDIFVYKNESPLFVIEAKLSPSQSGQFVVLLKDNEYIYSKLNFEKQSELSKQIVDKINQNIARYINCGSAGVKVEVEKEILMNWVKEHYINKRVKFVISSDAPKNFSKNFIRLINIQELYENFEVNAVIRCKKSGSRHIPIKDIPRVKELLKNKFGDDVELVDDGKLLIKNRSIKIEKDYLEDGFYLTIVDGKPRVTKLSNTNNPSIIFSLKYIGEKQTSGFEELQKEINNSILQNSS